MLRREASRSSEALWIELAADGEHGVADGFDFEAAVAHERFRRFAHLPRTAGEDETVQLFQRPAGIVHEPIREPVEQFRLRGNGAHEAEIVGGGHEALTEVLLPDAVHNHARGEWILRAGDPLREAEAALRGLFTRWKLRLLFDENGRHRRLNEIAKAGG